MNKEEFLALKETDAISKTRKRALAVLGMCGCKNKIENAVITCSYGNDIHHHFSIYSLECGEVELSVNKLATGKYVRSIYCLDHRYNFNGNINFAETILWEDLAIKAVLKDSLFI